MPEAFLLLFVLFIAILSVTGAKILRRTAIEKHHLFLFLLPLLLFFFSDSKENAKIFIHLPLVAEPWSDDISYYNDSSYEKTLSLALERWQSTGIPISFKETKEREEADIIIKDDASLLEKSCIKKGCSGHARIGYTAFDWRENEVLLSPLSQEEKRQEKEVVNTHHLVTVIHELGHVLGLDHNKDSCSIMNEKSICRQAIKINISESGKTFTCAPFKDDVINLAKLYRFQPTFPRPYCFDPAGWDYYISKR